LDDHGDNDITGWSRADLLRFYPTNTSQFGVVYGYRNRTESVHSQMKRGMPRIPAYGVTRQTLYILGYLIGHNAVAFALHRQRDGLPNALDGTG
ncbi:MAG: hypothetical protein WCI74_07460, partial [Actinomycetes bacterium]